MRNFLRALSKVRKKVLGFFFFFGAEEKMQVTLGGLDWWFGDGLCKGHVEIHNLREAER